MFSTNSQPECQIFNDARIGCQMFTAPRLGVKYSIFSDEERVVARVCARWRHLGGGEEAGSEISSPPPLARLLVSVR